MKYRHKPIVIEAKQFDGFNYMECAEFMGFPNPFRTSMQRKQIYLDATYGDKVVNAGDFIIRQEDGSFIPCSEDEFRRLYDRVE